MTVEQRASFTAMNQNLAERIALEIRSTCGLHLHLLGTLCDIAGLSDEWTEALFDCDGYEDVANRAAEILGVDI